MNLLRGIAIGARNSVLAVSLLALSGCTTLTSTGGIAVTQTGDNPAPTVVPEDRVRAALATADAILVSDYGAGVTRDPRLRALRDRKSVV